MKNHTLFVICPDLAWNVILGADFLIRSKSILDYSTRSVRFSKETPHSVESISDLAGSEFHHLFQHLEIRYYSSDSIYKRLTNVTDDEIETLLRRYPDLSTWEDGKIGRTSVLKHTIDAGSDKPICQPEHRIPPSLIEEVERTIK